VSVAAYAGEMPVDGEDDQECCICGAGSTGRVFLGEYLLSVGPEIVAWEWELEGGRMVFVADTREGGAAVEGGPIIALDTLYRTPYCLECADEATSDRGLPPNTRVAVFAS
jgi:hypothetical protein